MKDYRFIVTGLRGRINWAMVSIFRWVMLFVILQSALTNIAADETEDELQRFSDALKKEIQDSGRKKVAILDFSDLQSNPSEIGRYVAEQTTVNLVSSRASFKVVDRANLKSILAEYKLTTTGLVQPDNARKLGEVSGVDALILGNVIVLGDSLQLTAKVIATDTAEIVGATKGRLRKTSELENLIGKPAIIVNQSRENLSPSPNAGGSILPTNTAKAAVEVPNRQTIDNLEVVVKSFNVRAESSATSGTIVLTINNIGNETMAVIFKRDPQRSCSILNKAGETIWYFEGSGIPFSTPLSSDFAPTPAVIQPGKSLRCVFSFHDSDRTFANFSPFQLQMSLETGQTEGGRYKNVQTADFLIDLSNANR